MNFNKMGFNNKSDSRQKVKRSSPKMQPVLKSNNHNQLRDGPRVQQTGLSHMHIKGPADVFLEQELDDLVLEKQLSCAEELYDECDLMWLSSDCSSPSMMPSSDGSQDVYWDLFLADQFSSVLSLSKSYSVTFEGSRISPVDETPLVLVKPFKGSDGEDLRKDVSVWLHNLVGDDVKDSSARSSECGDSSYDRSICEDSSVFESSSASLSTQEDTPSCVGDFDRTDIWLSSLDLELEDSELVQDKEKGFDVSDLGFPSPSYKGRNNLQLTFSGSSSITSFTEEPGTPPKDCDCDEPLFWPFDQVSYQLPEFENNFLCLSPRKDGGNVQMQECQGLKSIRLRLRKKTNFTVGRENIQGECRSIVCNPPKSLSGKCKTRRSNNKCTLNIGTRPSRISGSAQASTEKYSCNISIKKRQLQLEATKEKHSCNKQLPSKPLLEREPSNFQDMVVDGVSIEKMVGLNEFDGLEGFDLFYDNDFILNGSPFMQKTIPSEDCKCTTNNSNATLPSCRRKLFTDDCFATEVQEDIFNVNLM